MVLESLNGGLSQVTVNFRLVIGPAVLEEPTVASNLRWAFWRFSILTLMARLVFWGNCMAP